MNDQSIVTTDNNPSEITSDATALVRIIERASLNPNVDIDKMERLLQMHERITARNAAMAFGQAMKDAQARCKPIHADAENKQTHSRYATYGALDKVLRPIYTSEGFSLSYDTADSHREDHIRVLCHVTHVGGHTRTHHVDMPSDGKGAKGGDVMTKTHAAGAAVEYGKRYLLKMIFNVAIGDDDNDGNGEKITKAQVADLLALLEETKSNVAAFCRYMKVDRVESIPATAYKHAVEMVEAKRQK